MDSLPLTSQVGKIGQISSVFNMWRTCQAVYMRFSLHVGIATIDLIICGCRGFFSNL